MAMEVVVGGMSRRLTDLTVVAHCGGVWRGTRSKTGRNSPGSHSDEARQVDSGLSPGIYQGGQRP